MIFLFFSDAGVQKVFHEIFRALICQVIVFGDLVDVCLHSLADDLAVLPNFLLVLPVLNLYFLHHGVEVSLVPLGICYSRKCLHT